MGVSAEVRQVYDDAKGLVTAPFIGKLDLWSLFLVTGAVLFFVMVWGMILYHIRLAATELT